MPKAHVFACPSCGASLSVDEGASTTRCQFCGNTVIVPKEIREAGQPAHGAGGMATGAPLKELGNLIRAGDKVAAVKLYRSLFGGELAAAQSAVDRLALGQGVPVVYMGMPTTLLVDRSPTASASPTPTFMAGGQPLPPASFQPVQPVIVTGNPTRNVGCILWAVFLTTALGILIAALAAGGAMLPMFAFMFGDDGLGGILTSVPGVSSTLVPAATRAPALTSPTPAAPGFATTVLSFGSAGNGGGAFNDPRHIGVDGAGNIYVGEWQAHRVQVFDAQGEFITEWLAGENDAILTSMSVAPDGTVYTVAGTRLYYYDGATGEQLGQIEYEGPTGFQSVTVGHDGNVYMAWSQAATDTLLRYRDGQFDLRLPNALSRLVGQSEVNISLAADGDGEIYALGGTRDRAFHFADDGELLNEIGLGNGDEAGQFTAPTAIAVDLFGRAYIADIRGIQVFSNDGEFLTRLSVPSPGVVFGLTVDQDGSLYAVSNNNLVSKFQINE